MIYAVINCLLYCSLFFIYNSGKNKIDIYKIIVLLYLVTAILCLANYAQKPYLWPNLSLFPFIYMFGILLILFYPIQHFDLSSKITRWNDTKALYWLGWFYIFLSIIDVAMSYNEIIQKFNAGEWRDLRNELYAGGENIVYYTNIWQKLDKNIVSYLHPFAIVYAFYQATIPSRKTYTVLLFLSIVSVMFVSATVVASRGMVFNLSMEMILVFWLFREKISTKVKRILISGGSTIIIGFLVYALIVSVSRFGEDEAGNSIFRYFGISMLYFNDGLFNYLQDFAYGKRFFAWFIDLYGGDSSFDFVKAGSRHGTSFFTIVGSIYSDWGFLGTIIVSFLACILICYFTRKKVIRLSDMVIIVFYIITLSGGIFAYGNSRGLQWIMTFVVYYIVRALEKPLAKK